MTNIIEQLDAEQMQGKSFPDFAPGDTIVVQVRVIEGTRSRLQAFEGVVIAKRSRGLNSAFTVRKISHGEGVERVFQTYSPTIEEIIVKRRGKVRRAKLYYLRDRSGRSARIKEKLPTKKGEKPGAPKKVAKKKDEKSAKAAAPKKTAAKKPVAKKAADKPAE